MPNATHLWISTDELYDAIVDAMRSFIVMQRNGIAVKPAADAAIRLAVANAVEAERAKHQPALQAVRRA